MRERRELGRREFHVEGTVGGFEEGFVEGVFVGIFQMGVIGVPVVEIVSGAAVEWSLMIT